jgi:hypothetical protein
MTDPRLDKIRRRVGAVDARRTSRDARADRAEQLGLPDLAARVRAGATWDDLYWHERLALEERPRHDYGNDTPLSEAGAIDRLAAIGENRPGHLIGTVKTQLNILARANPEQARKGLAILDRLDPADRRGDLTLVTVRQLLGRAMSLGWPDDSVKKAIRKLAALKRLSE